MQTTGLYKTQLEGTLQRNTNSSSKWNKTLNEGPMGPPIKRHNMDRGDKEHLVPFSCHTRHYSKHCEYSGE